jgi:energy-coupling factor transporter ATP-binding protein EcfA2
MLFLVTGASGVGKSTLRQTLLNFLPPSFWSCELGDIAGPPQWTVLWRQKAVEKVVRRALREQNLGKHTLLCGDPIPPAEIIAAPSGHRLTGLKVCLLDASPEVQSARLLARGDNEHHLHHQAFATWMRIHITNPLAHSEVIHKGAWNQMCWDRLASHTLPWHPPLIIDTTFLSPEAVAKQVLQWILSEIENPANGSFGSEGRS